jgi:anti-anti-sigma regulatory factor
MEYVSIQSNSPELVISILYPRIDGENHILQALKSGDYFKPEMTRVILDFDQVKYINSLGISEIINVHRNFSEITQEKAKLIFRNVDPKVLSILELIEIHKIVEIQPRKNEA